MRVQNTDIPYIERLTDGALASFLADDSLHKPVLLVEGAQQVGKKGTTSPRAAGKPRIAS